MKDSKSIKNIIIIVAAVAVILAWFLTDPAILSRATVPEPTTGSGTAANNNNNSNSLVNTHGRIAVGSGNTTVSINQFSPSVMNIQPGENVTFYAPKGSTEIHNVIFDLSNGTAISDIELPFIMPQGVTSEALQLAPPNNIGEPIIQNTSDGRQEIFALNKVAFQPSVVDQDGNVSYLQEHDLMQQIEQARQQGMYMPPLSANYTMQGTEKIVSLGLIVDFTGFGGPEQGGGGGGETVPSQSTANNNTNPELDLPPAAYPVLSDFTVTFEKPGTYPFFCAFHPGMFGVVKVAE